MSWPAYEPAGPRCTSSAQPGASALMAWAVGDFGQGARNWGIYNCRTIAGSRNRSLHGEGRAIDVGFSGVANPAGTRLLNVLLANVGPLGIQLIIWNRRLYSRQHPRGVRYMGASPHTDHLHIELTWHAARTLTRARVRQVVGGASQTQPAPQPRPPVHPQPQPQPEIDPEEDDDMAQTLIRHADGGIWHYQGKARSHCSPSDVDRYRFLGVELVDVSQDRALSDFFLKHSFDVAHVGETALRATWLQTVVGRIADKVGARK